MDKKRNVIEQIINKFTTEIKQTDDNKPVIDSLKFISMKTSYCKAYPEISDIIYHLNDSKFDQLKKNFALYDEVTENQYEAFLTDKNFSDGESLENLRRFERHIRLSCYQRDYILDQAKNARELADSANEVSKNATHKVGHIYSEFVGILAIFTALSFAMMGSVQMLGNLFNNINHPTTGTLGYALILAGIYLITIYLLIMTLVLAMKKLFSDKADNYQFNWSFVWVVSVASAVLILVGIFLTIIFKIWNLGKFYN